MSKKTIDGVPPLLLVDDDDPMQMAVQLVQVSHLTADYAVNIEIYGQFSSIERYLTIKDMVAMRDWLDKAIRAEAEAALS